MYNIGYEINDFTNNNLKEILLYNEIKVSEKEKGDFYNSDGKLTLQCKNNFISNYCCLDDSDDSRLHSVLQSMGATFCGEEYLREWPETILITDKIFDNILDLLKPINEETKIVYRGERTADFIFMEVKFYIAIRFLVSGAKQMIVSPRKEKKYEKVFPVVNTLNEKLEFIKTEKLEYNF